MINEKGEEVGIIYGWYNTLTDMWYIGQTIDEEGRFKRHIDDGINKRDNIYFHRALRKYGLDNFVYCVLEDNVLRANLNMREMDWIEYYDSFYCGYNLTLGGRKNTIFSEEVKEKLKGKLAWNKGKHHSEETKRKLSESHKGRTTWNKGKHHSEETKRKLSESHKGRTTWMKGKKHTEEAKRKISEHNKGKKLSEETRIKMSKLHGKKVNKYDLSGNFIKEYSCIKDAVKENLKASHISAVCKGYRKTSGGFIWKYA